ncbi:MAG: hypothetical protein E7293_10450 [Lachnospiraceae bacterium]|nr:hypothetical protein [Lachnospiraceae bacterium]
MRNDFMVDLLRVCSKMKINKEEENIIAQCVTKFDWDMANILEMHKIHMIFLKHVNNIACSDNLAFKIIENFSNQLFYLQFKYEEYLTFLKNVVDHMQTIDYAVLKGGSFIDVLYKENDIIYRPFADIDILISKRNINLIDGIMKENNLIQGKVRQNKIIPAERKDVIYWKLNSHQLHEYIGFSKYSQLSNIYRIEFDFNTTIFEGGKEADPIDMDWILKRRKKRKVKKDLEIYCLDHTLALLQLCYHFYKDTIYEVKKLTHDNYCLLKFCDIREYIIKYRYDINWKEFIDIVNQANIGNQIYNTLWLISTFYGDLYIEDIIKQINVTERYYTDNIDWESMLL